MKSPKSTRQNLSWPDLIPPPINLYSLGPAHHISLPAGVPIKTNQSDSAGHQEIKTKSQHRLEVAYTSRAKGEH